MRRRKRLTIIRIGLALAATAAVLPVAAQAKPLPSDPIMREYQARAYTLPAEDQRTEIPYLSHGSGVTEAQLGIAGSNSPDDRAFARTSDPQPVVVVDDASGFDVNPLAVTGFGLALMLVAGGMALAIRHSRKGRLSPA
ncbi:MAG TPA: hypothetical protein VH968_10580 [Gaiellaceae bacterium]|jgi:hypothetical protein